MVTRKPSRINHFLKVDASELKVQPSELKVTTSNDAGLRGFPSHSMRSMSLQRFRSGGRRGPLRGPWGRSPAPSAPPVDNPYRCPQAAPAAARPFGWTTRVAHRLHSPHPVKKNSLNTGADSPPLPPGRQAVGGAVAGVQPPRGEACLPGGSGGCAPCRGAPLGRGRDAGGRQKRAARHCLFLHPPAGGLLSPASLRYSRVASACCRSAKPDPFAARVAPFAVRPLDGGASSEVGVFSAVRPLSFLASTLAGERLLPRVFRPIPGAAHLGFSCGIFGLCAIYLPLYVAMRVTTHARSVS